MNKYAENARRGADFLDERYPGWHRKIDRDALDMGWTSACVGGQIEGRYSDFKDATGMNHEQMVELGFEIATNKQSEYFIPVWEYQDLTAAMLREINIRPAADALVEEAEREMTLELV